MSKITLRMTGIRKSFGNVAVLKGRITREVQPGEANERSLLDFVLPIDNAAVSVGSV